MKCKHAMKKKLCKYICAKCGKGFANKMHYQIHADRHNDMKCYSSGKCDYQCYSTSQLDFHVTNCIDGINHECLVCGKEFMQKQYLKNHFKQESHRAYGTADIASSTTLVMFKMFLC